MATLTVDAGRMWSVLRHAAWFKGRSLLRDYESFIPLMNQHGSAFYLLDLAKVRMNVAGFEKAFRGNYPNVNFSYSYKTNYIPQVCRLVRDAGWLAEVVSEMEYDFARRFGNPAKNIVVNGPIKTQKQLSKFLTSGSIVHLDSLDEVMATVSIAETVNSAVRVGIRCNFQCGEHVSRFGIDTKGEDLKWALDRLNSAENVHVVGIHCHFPNRDLKSFQIRAREMARLVRGLTNLDSCYIDLGGGFFGRMPFSLMRQFDDAVPTFEEYAAVIANVLIDEGVERKVSLLLEPGSAVVADAMCFVAKVENVKSIHGKVFATVAGSRFNLGRLGSTLNLPLTVLYDEKTKRPEYRDVDIVGYTCIEGDVLYRGYNGNLAAGDIVVFDNAGSYSYVFKPPFIRPNAAILIHDSEDHTLPVLLSKRRETAEDVLATFKGV